MDERLYRIRYRERHGRPGVHLTKPLGPLTLKAHLEGFREAKRHRLIRDYTVLTLTTTEAAAARRAYARPFP